MQTEKAVTGQDVNWFPEVIEISGEPLTGFLEIRAGQVHLVREMLPVSDRIDAIRHRPDTESSTDRRVPAAEF